MAYFMFQNVAYRATVYRTGNVGNIHTLNGKKKRKKHFSMSIKPNVYVRSRLRLLHARHSYFDPLVKIGLLNYQMSRQLLTQKKTPLKTKNLFMSFSYVILGWYHDSLLMKIIMIVCWWKLSKQTSYWSKTVFFSQLK